MQKLNIVCRFNNNPIIKPLCAAFTLAGHETVLWWQEAKPVFDMMHERKPDVLICEGADLNRNIVAALGQFQETKLVVFNPTPEQRNTYLYNKTFFCYTHKPKTSLQLEVFEPAANIAQIKGGKFTEELSSDILIYSNDDSLVDYRLIGAILDKCSHLKIKVFGQNRINIPYYLGTLSFDELSNAIASTKIAVDFGDMYVTYAANNTYTMTHFDNEYWPVIKYDDYTTQLLSILENDRARKKFIKLANKKALNGNTMVDRANYILSKLLTK